MSERTPTLAEQLRTLAECLTFDCLIKGADRIEELERALSLEGKSAPWIGSVMDKLERENASLRAERDGLVEMIASGRTRQTHVVRIYTTPKAVDE